jgi:hypothetical protein
LGKADYLTIKLRAVPTEADSQTYELNVPYFQTGTPEEWLLTKKAILKVIASQNITTGPGRFAMARRILDGDALAAFNETAEKQTLETTATFVICMDAVTKHIFPKHSLQEQRRYMRRYLCKPRELKNREFQARVSELNSYLKEFPGADASSALSHDNLIELLEFANPTSWQKHMVLQGFNPVTEPLSKLVEFCERIEYAETVDSAAKKPENLNARMNTSKKVRDALASSSSGRKWINRCTIRESTSLQ